MSKVARDQSGWGAWHSHRFASFADGFAYATNDETGSFRSPTRASFADSRFVRRLALRWPTRASLADSRFVGRLALRWPTRASLADSFARVTNDDSLLAGYLCGS